MTIKKGTLVKAWDDDPSDYDLVILLSEDEQCNIPFLTENGWYKNAIEIPPELAKALEELK